MACNACNTDTSPPQYFPTVNIPQRKRVVFVCCSPFCTFLSRPHSVPSAGDADRAFSAPFHLRLPYHTPEMTQAIAMCIVRFHCVSLCCGTWTRTKILCSRGICPTIRRSRNRAGPEPNVLRRIPERRPLFNVAHPLAGFLFPYSHLFRDSKHIGNLFVFRIQTLLVAQPFLVSLDDFSRGVVARHSISSRQDIEHLFYISAQFYPVIAAI